VEGIAEIGLLRLTYKRRIVTNTLLMDVEVALMTFEDSASIKL